MVQFGEQAEPLKFTHAFAAQLFRLVVRASRLLKFARRLFHAPALSIELAPTSSVEGGVQLLPMNAYPIDRSVTVRKNENQSIIPFLHIEILDIFIFLCIKLYYSNIVLVKVVNSKYKAKIKSNLFLTKLSNFI